VNARTFIGSRGSEERLAPTLTIEHRRNFPPTQISFPPWGIKYVSLGSRASSCADPHKHTHTQTQNLSKAGHVHTHTKKENTLTESASGQETASARCTHTALTQRQIKKMLLDQAALRNRSVSCDFDFIRFACWVPR